MLHGDDNGWHAWIYFYSCAFCQIVLKILKRSGLMCVTGPEICMGAAQTHIEWKADTAESFMPAPE